MQHFGPRANGASALERDDAYHVAVALGAEEGALGELVVQPCGIVGCGGQCKEHGTVGSRGQFSGASAVL